MDDRWENRQIVIKLLEPVGFAVKEASNGNEAVEIWQEWQPHLIWMDMRMPIMNGYEATKQIKSSLQGQAVYIIALTASTFESERAVVMSAGCDDFVHKPFRQEVLFEKMAQYLGVEYIYEQKQNSDSAGDRSSQGELTLDAKSLQAMSPNWLTQLETAAAELDSEAMSLLISQIADEHQLLARILEDKVDNFDYDQIVKSIQQVANH